MFWNARLMVLKEKPEVQTWPKVRPKVTESRSLALTQGAVSSAICGCEGEAASVHFQLCIPKRLLGVEGVTREGTRHCPPGLSACIRLSAVCRGCDSVERLAWLGEGLSKSP